MQLTIRLLTPGTTAVRGQDHARERLPFVQVTPKAPVRLAHFGTPVGHLTRTWTADDGTLWAEATIDSRHEDEVRAALDQSRAGSIEFTENSLESELLPWDDWEPGRTMVYRDAKVGGVAIGITTPGRADTQVVRVSPPPPKPARTVQTSTPAPVVWPKSLRQGDLHIRPSRAPMRHSAPMGQVLGVY